MTIDYQMIMTIIIWKRIKNIGMNWMHVYKGSTVLACRVAHCSGRAIEEIKKHTYPLSVSQHILNLWNVWAQFVFEFRSVLRPMIIITEAENMTRMVMGEKEDETIGMMTRNSTAYGRDYEKCYGREGYGNYN